jgi:hypothetical protein
MADNNSPFSSQSIFEKDSFLGNNHSISIKFRRNTAIACCASLLIHAAVLFAYYPKKLVNASSSALSIPKTINVQLVGIPSKTSPPLKAVEQVKKDTHTPAVIAVENNAITPSPQPIIKPPTTEEISSPKDLMSFIKARKQRTQDMEAYAAIENANARSPSDEEIRDANIRNNIQQRGTSGIFEILRKNSNTARFSFKGWKNDFSIPKREIVDVAIGTNEDLDIAIVRKMIEIIRREYTGDFNWESQRLGRVIVLSARLNDNAGLEAFLKNEFFSQERLN